MLMCVCVMLVCVCYVSVLVCVCYVSVYYVSYCISVCVCVSIIKVQQSLSVHRARTVRSAINWRKNQH